MSVDDRLVPPVRVVVVVGTRPEAIKLFPVIHELKRSPWLQPFVVTTGQHQELCRDVLEAAHVTVDDQLSLERSTGTINELSSQIIERLGGLLEALCADHANQGTPPVFAVMVHGDTTSAMAAALAAGQAGVPVVHVEAGLRTYNPHGPFPEEMNRTIIARIASIQIAPTGHNEANLIREGVREGIVHVSGNTSIDALMWATRQTPRWPNEALAMLVHGGAPIVVVTLHRRENWDRLHDMASALLDIVIARPDVHVVLPMHPNPRVRESLREVLGANENIHLIDALGYVEFAHLLQCAQLVVTDSGGIQEEAPSVGTPVLVARRETERDEGVEVGTLLLVGDDPDAIARETLRLLNDPSALQAMRERSNPFGDGQAARRIRELLEYVLMGGDPPSAFPHAISRSAVLKVAGYRDVAVRLQSVSVDDHVAMLADQVAIPGIEMA